MNKDFSDLLSAFNAHNVRYVIVGGYAYARYTEPRATKDLDLFIDTDRANASAIYAALQDFGANLTEVTEEDFANPVTIFQIGVAPLRVDLLCHIDGVEFGEAWTSSELTLLEGGVPARYISVDLLIANKMAAGRPQDLVDAQKLKEAAGEKAHEQ